MPTYDYECPDCGGFEAIRSMSARNEPADCPHCGKAAPRVMVASFGLSYMESTTLKAMDGVKAVMCAVPYYFNMPMTEAAIDRASCLLIAVLLRRNLRARCGGRHAAMQYPLLAVLPESSLKAAFACADSGCGLIAAG